MTENISVSSAPASRHRSALSGSPDGTPSAEGRTVRIGCHSAFWGDSNANAAQLVRGTRLNYLVSDYLAEITMSLLVRARMKDPAAGYARDFLKSIGPLLPRIREQDCKVITNAGGINPLGLRDAIEASAAAHGLVVRVAVVEGDDLMGSISELIADPSPQMLSGGPFPQKPLSMNAYLGAAPIVRALALGANIVICGRCADSALVLGALMHEFGWKSDDHDRLAAGSLAGHVIECGTQVTGGIFTDWDAVPGWENIGLPIIEVQESGDFVVTKVPDTGGLVNVGTVAEQVLYEIGDPSGYVLPDVVCDFRDVRLTLDGPDRVRVTGARGFPPTPFLKVGGTHFDGYRLFSTLMIAGGDAAQRARRTGRAILARASRLLDEAGHVEFTETSVEVIGAEDSYGAGSKAVNAREVVLKVAARHPDQGALEILAAEIAPSAVSMAQGITGLFGGRPTPSPVVRFFSFLYDRRRVIPTLHVAGLRINIPHDEIVVRERHEATPPDTEHCAVTVGDEVTVPLRKVAFGRSGDKGDNANIGIISRHPEYWPLIGAQFPAERVARVFAHYLRGEVRRYPLSGLCAYNFVLENVLGGGGVASLRYDPQGKTYAQILLDEPVVIPRAWLAIIGETRGIWGGR